MQFRNQNPGSSSDYYTQRGAEDTGISCQLQLNKNMMNFIQNRYECNNF
jgi:hypothetical protein